MIPIWKQKQIKFNRKGHFRDNLYSYDAAFIESSDEDLIEYIIWHFTTPLKTLLYPAKSYYVAIIYSHLIECLYNVPFFTSLDDKNLLCGNDGFFKIYSESKHIYDKVLDRIANFELNLEFEHIRETFNYFCEEFEEDLECIQNLTQLKCFNQQPST